MVQTHVGEPQVNGVQVEVAEGRARQVGPDDIEPSGGALEKVTGSSPVSGRRNRKDCSDQCAVVVVGCGNVEDSAAGHDGEVVIAREQRCLAAQVVCPGGELAQAVSLGGPLHPLGRLRDRLGAALTEGLQRGGCLNADDRGPLALLGRQTAYEHFIHVGEQTGLGHHEPQRIVANL